MPNVRLQARAACGASLCEPLFGGTCAQSALIWTFAAPASRSACEQRAHEEVCDEQQQVHVKQERELHAGRAAEGS